MSSAQPDARTRDLTFTSGEWEAFGAAIEGRFPDRRAAARTIIGEWLAVNGWQPDGGTIPGDITAQLAAVRATTARVHRQLVFNTPEWEGLTAAAAAAGVPRSVMLRAILRAWIPDSAWEQARTAAGPPPGLTERSAVVLREILRTPGEPRSGGDLAAATETATATVYQMLRRLEEQGWLQGEQEAENPHGRGRPPRTFYTLTPMGLAEARKLLGDTGGDS